MLFYIVVFCVDGGVGIRARNHSKRGGLGCFLVNLGLDIRISGEFDGFRVLLRLRWHIEACGRMMVCGCQETLVFIAGLRGGFV